MRSVERWSRAGAAMAVCLAVVVAALGGCHADDSTPGCPLGSTMCGSRCANLQEDPSSCGACGKACGPLEICDRGACTTGIGDAAHDAPLDVAADVTVDALVDAPADAAVDAAVDAAADAPVDAQDSGDEGG